MGWLLQPPRPNLRPLPLPRLMLIPGMDTTAMASTDLMAMDTTDTGLMAMDTTMERGLLMLSLKRLLLLMLLLPLMLMPGMDTMAGLMPMVMDTGLMAMDTTDTERGLPMLSPLLRLMLPLRLRLIPGTDTTMERGLPMLSPLLRLSLPLRLRLIPGTDTMDMACTDLMAMDTMDTGPMVMDTGERSKKHDSCQTAAN